MALKLGSRVPFGMVLQSRRAFILSLGSMTVGLPLGLYLSHRWWSQEDEIFLSAAGEEQGQVITAFERTGRVRFSLPVAERCHGIAVSPRAQHRVVVFPRRPGHTAYEVDVAAGELRQSFQCAPNRFFYGHGCFSADGSFLFASENDYVAGRGVITVRETDTYQIVAELDSHGIGPHEILLHPDGTHLIVANGGILERPDVGEGREILNVDTMQPSLVYLDPRDGALLGEYRLPDRLLSIRHLALTGDNGVAIALQYQGDPSGTPCLVAFHDGQGELVMGHAPQRFGARMQGFALSICAQLTYDVVAVSCPKGNEATFWSIRERSLLKSIAVIDCSGISLSRDGHYFIVTSGNGELLHVDAKSLVVTTTTVAPQRKWDNHLARLGVGI